METATSKVCFHYSKPTKKSGSRYTFATIQHPEFPELFVVAAARCDGLDNFCKKRGRAIALSRLNAFLEGFYRIDTSTKLMKYISIISSVSNAAGERVLPRDFKETAIQDWRFNRSY